MAKWIKNISGETRSFVGVDVTNGSFYQIPASKEIAFMENADINTWVADGDAQMSEDGSTVITDVSAGIQFLYGYPSLRDSDGAPLSRVKIARSGTKFRLHCVDFKTADLDSMYDKKGDGTAYNCATLKLYDSSDDEITSGANEGNAVKTVITFEPPDIDYEIIGGGFVQEDPSSLNDPMRAWAIGVPTVPAQYGGSIHFLTGLRLDYVRDAHFEMDGRVPKLMEYDETNHTSRFDFIFKHGTGVQHGICIFVEIYEI
jgi:hypothetical protein